MDKKYMDKYYKTKIAEIEDEDFFNSPRCENNALKEIVSFYKKGDKNRAYSSLSEYHKGTLEKEWCFVQKTVFEKKEWGTIEQNAKDVLNHKIKGWRETTIQFGKQIDFNANFGKTGQYGFHYLFWFTPIIDCYIRTGKKVYRECLLDIVRQYYAQRLSIKRRYPFVCPVYYELGAWAKLSILFPAYTSLIHKSDLSANDTEIFMKLFLGFARSLMKSFLNHGYSPKNNHQLVGTEALFRIAGAFPEFKEAAKWRKIALGLMIEHLKKSFFSDGGYSERNWHYGWMSLEGVINFYRTGQRHNLLGNHKSLFLKKIRSALKWFAKTVTPTGLCPSYGDDPLTESKDIFKTARGFFPQKVCEKSAFLDVDRSSSCILKPSGYAIMRDGDDEDALYMNINFGKTGGWHTHEDILDFNIWGFGKPLIKEAGFFGSYDNPLDPFFRSAEAHNQVLIDHLELHRKDVWGKNLVWKTNEHADYFYACHDGFCQRKHDYNPIRIHRHILFVKGSYWVIFDCIEAKEITFSASSFLHSPYPFIITGKACAKTKGSPGIAVVLARSELIKRFETNAEIKKEEFTDNTFPPLFPERYRLRAKTWMETGWQKPVTFTMLLYPFKKRPPELSIKPVLLKGNEYGIAECFEVITPRGRDIVVFNRDKRRLVSGKRKINSDIFLRLHGRSNPVFT